MNCLPRRRESAQFITALRPKLSFTCSTTARGFSLPHTQTLCVLNFTQGCWVLLPLTQILTRMFHLPQYSPRTHKIRNIPPLCCVLQHLQSVRLNSKEFLHTFPHTLVYGTFNVSKAPTCQFPSTLQISLQNTTVSALILDQLELLCLQTQHVPTEFPQHFKIKFMAGASFLKLSS